MKYKFDLVGYHTIIVEADSKEKADEILANMSDEEILGKSVLDTAMQICSVSEVADNE